MWMHVEARDAKGRVYHLPVDKKGFDGEEYTIAADVLAYQDLGEIMQIRDFKGFAARRCSHGDRIFRMPYFDSKGRMTICQWNTARLGVDYRIGPRETKTEPLPGTCPIRSPRGGDGHSVAVLRTPRAAGWGISQGAGGRTYIGSRQYRHDNVHRVRLRQDRTPCSENVCSFFSRSSW